MMKKLLSTVLLSLLVLSGPAIAAGGNVKLDKAPVDVGNERSLQRGARNFVNSCMGCHGMKFLRYSRMAKDLGLTEEQVRENLMIDPKGSFGATMTINMPADQSKNWFGNPPPDLTLTARSRGSDWIYTYLRSFYKEEGRVFGVNNVVLPGASMPHVLEGLQGLPELVDDGQHHGDDHAEAGHGDGHGAEGTYKVGGATFKLASAGSMDIDAYDNYVGDLVNFMTYAAEPIRYKRQQLGIKVMAFLLVFFVLAYFLNKEYWKDVH